MSENTLHHVIGWNLETPHLPLRAPALDPTWNSGRWSDPPLDCNTLSVMHYVS